MPYVSAIVVQTYSWKWENVTNNRRKSVLQDIVFTLVDNKSHHIVANHPVLDKHYRMEGAQGTQFRAKLQFDP
jgi:hypothetical protein